MLSVDEIRLPTACVVVLVGPSSAGKSTWAEANFAANQVVSSDRLRAVVGAGEDDQRAGDDAFALLDEIVTRRLGRKLLTVIDTTALDDQRRAWYIEQAHAAGLPCFAVGFDVDPATCRDRNSRKTRPVPQKVLSSQLGKWKRVKKALPDEGFDQVFVHAPVAVVPGSMVSAPEATAEQDRTPVTLRFGLQISNFTWGGGPAELGNKLASIGRTAEAAGFSSLWVMDHFRQIPQVGPEWDNMLDSYTTLGLLAGVTERATLGTLVTAVGYRNPAHLGKIVATLDVLSAGRAVCGLGIGWFEKEATAYGWDFPPVPDRYALLEDTLALLPVMWGPGSREFRGKVLHVPEAMCYPRPIQEHIPILIGGSGEKTTLRLVARYADMCNLFGGPDDVRRKVDVLAAHCTDVGRDRHDIEVSHLSGALIAPDRAALTKRLDDIRPAHMTAEQLAERLNAGTAEDHIGRFRDLADAGVQHAIVALPDPSDLESITAFGEVIAAFAG